MYYIGKPKDLVGKTVAFMDTTRLSEIITIATTDGGVMVLEQYDTEVYICLEQRIMLYLFESDKSKLLAELQNLGIISDTEYEDWKEAHRLRRLESDRQQSLRKEKNERAELIRLKEKYEGIGPEFFFK